ncbi:MAG: hypothetical protein J4428_05515 [Candidatus Aenigmarchaeota archaeon]|nr:hypothetical protein [Candidatus Aenigmarchaeota archaeon]
MRICCGRGTSSMKMDISEMPWAGKSYLDYQAKKKEEYPESKILVMTRGTRKISLDKYPKSRRKIPESGFSLVSSRGTKILRF